MRILGLVRLHRFERPDWVIDEIEKHVDGMVYVTHDLQNDIGVNYARGRKKTLEIADNPARRFDNGKSLEYAFRVVAKHAPDVVVYFDEDEIPPERLGNELSLFLRSPAETMMFRFVYTWGDQGNVIEELSHLFWHGKVLKWREDFSIMPYGGYCVPRSHRERPAYRSPYVIRHACYTTQEIRMGRCGERGKSAQELSRIGKDGPTVHLYNPDTTYGEWRATIGRPIPESRAASGFFATALGDDALVVRGEGGGDAPNQF